MEKIYPVELNIFKENVFHGLQKIPLDNFPRNFYIWSAIVSGACMQKLKIGHRANFRAKNKCFRQILSPVRAILRSINFRYADFNTGFSWRVHLSYGVCRLRARVQLKTLSSLLKNIFSRSGNPAVHARNKKMLNLSMVHQSNFGEHLVC